MPLVTSRWAVFLATLGGVLTFLAFPDWNLSPLAWLCLLPTLGAIEGRSVRAAMGLGFVHGCVTNLGGFYWVVHMLETFAAMPAPAAIFLYVLLSAQQALVFVVWAGLCRWHPAEGWASRALRCAVALVAAEFTVPFIFPWYLANSQWNVLPFIQICEWTGVLGLSGVLAASSGLLFASIRCEKRWRPLALLTLLVVGLAGVGHWRIGAIEAQMDAAPHARVGMVEADVGIISHARPILQRNNLALHQRMSKILEAAGADLIVWPESAYNAATFSTSTARVPDARTPLKPSKLWAEVSLPESGHLTFSQFPELEDADADRAANISNRERRLPRRGFSTPLLFGAVTRERVDAPIAPGPRWQERRYNSALLIDGEGQIDGRIYHKNVLLAFGEYIPFGEDFPALYDLAPAASSFSRGKGGKIFSIGKLRILPTICYEGILPRWTREMFSTLDPNVMMNITNDAWYGKHGEPWLHFVLSIFRTVEHRRAMVRSTNTGVSAFVEPTGRLRMHSSVYDPELLLADVPLLEGSTVYQSLGDVLGWLSLVFLGWIGWRERP